MRYSAAEIHKLEMVGLDAQAMSAWERRNLEAEIRMKDLRQRLSDLSPERQIRLLINRAELARERLTSVTRGRLDRSRADGESLRVRLTQAMQMRMKDAEHAAARTRERLTAVNPLAVLQRGYALVYGDGERLLKTAAEAAREKDMTLQFADGRVKVTGKDER